MLKEIPVKKDFIIYKGTEFTIEWYYDSNDKSSASEYYSNLPIERQKKAMRLFKLLADIGKIQDEEKFRHEDDQIYAFKPIPDRFFCFFFRGGKVIVTNAYEKKTKKLSPREKSKALKAREDYINRCKAGKYYD